MSSANSAEQDGLLDLAGVLARIGREFRAASHAKEPTLDWYGATVELEAVVERGADGGVHVWVVDAGASASRRRTIKVTVNIAPHGGEPMVGGM